MKRFALIAAAAALAAPAVFAQSMPHGVIDHSAVHIMPPVDAMPNGYHAMVLPAMPGTVALAPRAATVATAARSNTAILGAGPAVVSSPAVTFTSGMTAIIDVPAHATSRPDFQRWLAWEGSRLAGRM